jgi:hypothetical protein
MKAQGLRLKPRASRIEEKLPDDGAAQRMSRSRGSHRCIKCVLIDLDRRFGAAHVDRDDVESTGTIEQPVAGEIVACQLLHPEALEAGDRLRGVPELVPAARLHFHEHHRRTIAGDDVQFATPPAITAGKNCVPAPFQLEAREIFSDFT